MLFPSSGFVLFVAFPIVKRCILIIGVVNFLELLLLSGDLLELGYSESPFLVSFVQSSESIGLPFSCC